jgi:ABC-type branched-subunit amino acid transport system substrate-binding protein
MRIKMKYYNVIAAAVFLLLQTVSFAQKASEREWKIFQAGVEQYKTGDYKNAARNFSLVIERLPNNRLITANYLMLAKTFYKQGRYKESLRQCDIFLLKFQNSSYVDDIYYLMGANYYRTDDFVGAAASWIRAAERGDNENFNQRMIRLAEQTIALKLDHRGINSLKREIKTPLGRQIILVAEAKKYLNEKDTIHAKMTLEQFFAEFKKGDPYYKEAQTLMQNLDTGGERVLRIAALLPLTGDNFDIGGAILNGAQFAVKMFNKKSDVKVELIPFDYGSTLIKALEKIQIIAADHSIAAVFGPLENDVAAACAAVINYNKLTMITPTASDKALTKISDYIVQLSIPVNILGESLADFNADSLSGKRFVTLAPLDPYFKDLTASFTNRLMEKGAVLAAQQWYSPGTKDFTEQFKKIKRVGLKLSFADSLMEADSTVISSDIDSLYRLYKEEKALEYSENNIKIDSADIPVKAFSAFYMPLYQDDINMIAPQFAYYNFQCQVLGNKDWYDLRELKRNKRYINGLIFSAEGYLNTEGWNYKQFRNNYRIEMKDTPEKYELRGYDDMNFIMQITSDGRFISRDNFLSNFLKLQPQKGIYLSFDVGEKRYNNAVRIIKYLYGQLVPLN